MGGRVDTGENKSCNNTVCTTGCSFEVKNAE